MKIEELDIVEGWKKNITIRIFELEREIADTPKACRNTPYFAFLLRMRELNEMILLRLERGLPVRFLPAECTDLVPVLPFTDEEVMVN